MTQPDTLDGMPKRLWSCTPTRLDTWLTCPRRYRFTYLEHRSKGAPWAHNSMGSAVHAALRDWYVAPSTQRTPAYATELVERQWLSDGFRDTAQSEAWRSRSAQMAASYVVTQDADEEPVGIERTVSAATHGMALSGRVDRIDLRASADGGEELVIVDYKTGRHPLTSDDARSSLALAIYVVSARRTLRMRARRVELHHLPSATVAAYEHTEESLERHLGRAEQIAQEASAAEQRWRTDLEPLATSVADGDAEAIAAVDAVFPAVPSTGCSWCDYRRWCPAGQDASQEIASWTALGARETD